LTPASFTPAWWLPGPNLQTLWGKFMRPRLPLELRLEKLDTPDGDFLDLYHLSGKADAPLLVLLHGLEGSLRSHYIHGLLEQASSRGWNAAVLLFRSCGDSLNRARRFYHSGETTDVSLALDHLESSYAKADLIIAGVSLGGNVLLKYLGERGERVSPRVRAAAAVSVPYDLAKAADYIDRGFSKVYQRSFIQSLQAKAVAKLDQFPDLIPKERIRSIRTMRDFDNSITAPLHGFHDADDYYSRSSAIGWVRKVRVDTLLLSAVDDPFLPPQVLDQVRTEAKDNPFLHLEFTRNGGHVGFVGGSNPFRPSYYMESRVGDFLAGHVPGFSSDNHNRGN
jgi:predicted alpha/beta-fold hydrolase